MLKMILNRFVEHFTREVGLNLYLNEAPNSAKLPFCVYSVISTTDNTCLNSRQQRAPIAREYLLQVDIYSATFALTQEKCELARAAIYNFEKPIIELNTQYLKDDTSYRAMIEFRFIE